MEDSFTGDDDLEASVKGWLQSKESADSESEEESSGSDSSRESAEEEEGGPSPTSKGRMEKRKGGKKDKDSGMFSVMAKVMNKALEQRGINNMAEVAMFAETLLKGMEKSKSTKRKGEDKDLELQGRNLIDEEFHIVDDAHKVVDWNIRNFLRPIIGDPSTYWKEGSWGTEVGPMLGTNLYLTHLFPLSVNPRTILAVYADCRHLHDGS